MKLQKTTNYKQFKYLPWNRDIDTSKLKELVKKMSLHNLSKDLPILVNKKYEPIKTKGMDLDMFMEENKAQWYQSAIPLISICEDLFEYTKDVDDQLNGDNMSVIDTSIECVYL